MKSYIKYAAAFAAVVLFMAQGCKPYEEEGIELPGAPSASFEWNFIDAVDSLGQVVGIDSNRVFVTAAAVDGAFLHLWDFGNGQTSDQTSDTAITHKRVITPSPTLCIRQVEWVQPHRR